MTDPDESKRAAHFCGRIDCEKCGMVNIRYLKKPPDEKITVLWTALVFVTVALALFAMDYFREWNI